MRPLCLNTVFVWDLVSWTHLESVYMNAPEQKLGRGSSTLPIRLMSVFFFNEIMLSDTRRYFRSCEEKWVGAVFPSHPTDEQWDWSFGNLKVKIRSWPVYHQVIVERMLQHGGWEQCCQTQIQTFQSKTDACQHYCLYQDVPFKTKRLTESWPSAWCFVYFIQTNFYLTGYSEYYVKLILCLFHSNFLLSRLFITVDDSRIIVEFFGNKLFYIPPA